MNGMLAGFVFCFGLYAWAINARFLFWVSLAASLLLIFGHQHPHLSNNVYGGI